MHDFKISYDMLSKFPFVFMIANSEAARQKSTNFASKSFLLTASCLFRDANNPSVSSNKIPSQGSIILENLKYVP